jgi:3-deoxy-D-manno-octulosonic acid kinase
LNISIQKVGSFRLLSPSIVDPSSVPDSHLDKPDEIKLNEQWFDASYWQTNQSVVGESKGRFTTWFVRQHPQTKGSTWVLRHYYRGGLIAKLSKDKFIFTGLAKTRVFQEIDLLLEMKKHDLPVPTVVGGRVKRNLFSYQCDLLMEKIEAIDLVAVLKNRALESSIWSKIGKTIAQFHLNGIDHSDLNSHNIMLDEQDKLWLIDFDRCSKRALSLDWQQSNIARLKRSFEKERRLEPALHFSLTDWDSLLEGYQNAMRQTN